MIQTNKKNDFYGLDQKSNRTNWKPMWFGLVFDLGYQKPMKTEPNQYIYIYS
jgi:hypothetical protein